MPRHTLSIRQLISTSIALFLIGQAGCSREAFRERADLDVQAVITQKNVFTEWQVQNWHVYPDPRARFSDYTEPDHPPFPPDDQAAYLLSPNPQRPGRGGAGRHEGDGYYQLIMAWDAQNRAEDDEEEAAERKKEQFDIDGGPGLAAGGLDLDQPGGYGERDPANPATGAEFAAVAGGSADYLRVFATDVKPYRIRLEQAVELALFNSREFQDRREDLYLAALPVTLERFGFAAQAFAAEQVIREATGSERPEGRGNRWRADTEFGVGRRFATGGELLVRLANQVVVDLSNRRADLAFSTISLTFVQPLLRGGGFAVTLEPLTLAERTLLYAIRSYARFRNIFYFAIAGGGNYTNNPYALQGLSPNLGRGIGANLTAVPVGYLPAVLRAAELDNERKNVATLEQFLRLFQNLKEGGGVNELQVVRVEQNLLRSRNNVLNSTRQYLNDIDNFKLQLGLPATLPLELDDFPLRPIRQQLNRYERVYDQLRQVEQIAGQFDADAAADTYRQRWFQLLTDSPLVRGTPFAERYKQQAPQLQQTPREQLDARLQQLAETRRKLLDEKAERELKNQPETIEQIQKLYDLEAEVDLIEFEIALRRYESRPWLAAPKERQSAEQSLTFRLVFELGMLVAVQPRNDRLVQIRETWPPLPSVVVEGCDLLEMPLDEAYLKAGQVALTNRLDLMNARAQVVDAWRQVNVRANALRGIFDIRYNLDAGTPGDERRIFNFSGSRTRHQLILNYDPPWIRRDERNQYRAAIISYQRQRRNLMAFEDNILTDNRQDIRLIRQLSEAYKLQQRAIELAYSQVDNARSTFIAPPDPAAPDTAGSVAALTQQLLEAQNSLLQAQNDLYSTWTNYQTTRIRLFLDMEILTLDARGLWTDESTLRNPQPDDDSTVDPGPGGTNDPVPELAPVEKLPAPREQEP